MAQELPIFYDVPDHEYVVPLDGVQYQLRLTWRERVASWRITVHDADGVELVSNRRLSPQSPVFDSVLGGPPGVLVAVGSDPYERDELRLAYFPVAELTALGVR
ncbi:MAG: hypothetical protein AAGA48_27570 [Myxococcota bacterium]